MAVRVTLYTRKDCHLCEEAKAVLARARAEEPFDLEIVDVDTDPALSLRYGEEVPAVLIGARKRFKYHVDGSRLLQLLRLEKENAGSDSMNEAIKTTPGEGASEGAGGRSLAPYLQTAAILIVLLGVVLYAFPPGTQKREFVKNGSAALPFELPLADGTGYLSLEKDLAGKVVLLNFWATWCGPCLEEMPSLGRLNAKLSAKGLSVVAVSEDDLAQLPADFAKKEAIVFPVLYDAGHRVANEWGTLKYPETYIIGRDGKVARKLFGPAQWDAPEALEYFEGLLAASGQEGAAGPVIPSDPGAARSPEREAMRKKIEERGGAPGVIGK